MVELQKNKEESKIKQDDKLQKNQATRMLLGRRKFLSASIR